MRGGPEVFTDFWWRQNAFRKKEKPPENRLCQAWHDDSRRRPPGWRGFPAPFTQTFQIFGTRTVLIIALPESA